MRLMSTCVFIYAMSSLQRCLPCIFVINVVTSTSMLTRHRDVADFSFCSAVILMPCKLDATERSMHILRYFNKDVLNIWLFSIHSCPCLELWSSLACHFCALLLLQNVSWQIVYMLFNFAMVVIVDPYMLWACSCLGLFHKRAFLLLVAFPCHVMLGGEWYKLTNMPTCRCSCYVRICHITCYVYMGAIISSDPFWLMVSKGLLFYAISRFMPCLCLPW